MIYLSVSSSSSSSMCFLFLLLISFYALSVIESNFSNRLYGCFILAYTHTHTHKTTLIECVNMMIINFGARTQQCKFQFTWKKILVFLCSLFWFGFSFFSIDHNSLRMWDRILLWAYALLFILTCVLIFWKCMKMKIVFSHYKVIIEKVSNKRKG